MPNDSHARNAFGQAAASHTSDADPSAWTPVPWENFSADLAASHPQYRVTGFINHGGMGAVYQAETTDEKGAIKLLAIKALRHDALHDAKYLARFEREISLLEKIDHPHIVRILAHGQTAAGTPFFVMPLLQGKTLQAILAGPRLLQATTLRIMEQICCAIALAHLQGIIHRDLKPANIFVTFSPDGTPHVTILDFGVARDHTDTSHPPTLPGDAPGTHGYMAPEVLRGGKASFPADIYALGIIAHELLSGGPAEAAFETPALEPIVAKATHHSPGKRYQTATEFAEALKTLSTQKKTHPAPAMADSETEAEITKKNPVIEIDDFKITINGLDFTFCATIDQVIQALGSYSRTKNLFSCSCDVLSKKGICAPYSDRYSTSPHSIIYYWDEIGISVLVSVKYRKTPFVVRFQIHFEKGSILENRNDCINHLMDGKPVIEKTRKNYRGRFIFNGIDSSSDNAVETINLVRQGNVGKTVSSSGEIRIVSPTQKEFQSDPQLRIDNQISSDYRIDSKTRVSFILASEESKIVSTVILWPMTATKRWVGGVDLGECLGLYTWYGFSGNIRTDNFSTPNESFSKDEYILLTAPGWTLGERGQLCHDNSWRGLVDILLTNKRVLVRTRNSNWTSYFLSDFPEIIEITSENSGEELRNRLLGEEENLLLTLIKWLFYRLEDKFNLNRSSNSHYALVAKIWSKSKSWTQYRTSHSFTPQDEKFVELYIQQIRFLFWCANIIASDQARLFPQPPNLNSKSAR